MSNILDHMYGLECDGYLAEVEWQDVAGALPLTYSDDLLLCAPFHSAAVCPASDRWFARFQTKQHPSCAVDTKRNARAPVFAQRCSCCFQSHR